MHTTLPSHYDEGETPIEVTHTTNTFYIGDPL